ncbi:IS5 family transposase [Klebsiella spallanzanii]|uniref:IS5 family transposase n=1 Tax=Klebsiella spallanzanii TaxID=2587528 RepID=UPI0011575656|nr:IS5 family transposase [Klebsiella spallanzanii]
MAKQKFKITNWKTYNHALRQRGSLTIWVCNDATTAWYDTAEPTRRGRPLHYTDTAITTALMLKSVFHLTLRALQGFIDSVFQMMNVPLRSPDYTSVSKRARTVNVNIKTPTRGEIAHLVIDSTGLKVFGEGEWKVKKHGAEKRRVWRKLHLAVDAATHEIVCADLSLSNVTDAQVLPGLMSQTHRRIKEGLADGAYDVRYCHDSLKRKKIKPVIPPRNGAKYWPQAIYPERNQAVAHQLLTGNNEAWKEKVGYHRRSVAETAMSRVKKVCGGRLSLRNYDAQVGEAMALVKVLNRMTLQGMPNSVRIA